MTNPAKHILWLLVFLSSYLHSPQPAPDLPESTPVFHLSTNLVVLDALVETRKTEEAVGSLDRADFQLTEDGVPQTITYFSHDKLPLSVVFLFDLTDTVRPALKPLAEGAREVLDHLKPQDQTAVMVFSSHTELLQPFTADRSLAAGAIEKASEMKSDDGTFIHESMFEAVDEAMKSTAPGTRRVLIWLTDGTANFENSFTQRSIGKQAPALLHTKEEATDKLLRSEVVVSALIQRTASTDALVVAANANPFFLMFGARTGDIWKYADETGGPVLNTTKQEVAARLAMLIDQIRDRYTLGYKPSVAKPAGTFCKIQLQLAPGVFDREAHLKKGNLVVRTRLGYYR
jgi:Ca-activated chloride channel family protein